MRQLLHAASLLALVALLVLVSVPAWAGKKPSEENCASKGLIDVKCYICSTKEYKGKVSIQAEYDPDYGDCMKRYREARSLCIDAYDMPSNDAGCSWKYSMGGTEYTGNYPGSCKP